MRSGRRRHRGFSFIELMVVVLLATIAVTLGFTGLKKATTSGSSRGLATAVAAELRLAREKAIVKGSPVAVVLPQGVGQSLFFLEGDTLPVVTRSVDYSGDYPRGGMAVVSYGGPAFSKNAEMLGAKSEQWRERLDDWLPDAYRNDFVLMFTPNGSVVSNDLPAADGSYRLVVGMGMTAAPGGAPGGTDHVSGNDGVYYRLQSAGEPYTLALSQSGGVREVSGVLGQDGSVGSSAGEAATAAAPPPVEISYTKRAPDIFRSRVTPPAEMVDDNPVHIIGKGEYLTLEVFAHSKDGRPLYADWNDTPLTADRGDSYKGSFSVPNGEPERMEFYPEFDTNDNGTIEPQERNVWRSTWTWTPPKRAEAGDKYRLGVDVKDATLTVESQLPEPLPPVEIAPPGEIVFERYFENHWHLFTMWADGSRLTRITNGSHHYRYASATADGKTIAYELDGREVWIMNSDGTNATKVADGRCPTISPVGNCIAYLEPAPPIPSPFPDPGRDVDVLVKRLGENVDDVPPLRLPSREACMKSQDQITAQAQISNRAAFSVDGRWLYYTSQDDNARGVASARLRFNGTQIQADVRPTVTSINTEAHPDVSGFCASNRGEIYFHGDRNDPFIGRFRLDPDGTVLPQSPIAAMQNNPDVRYSPGVNEAFPAISPNQDLLLFCRETGTTGEYEICRVPMNSWNEVGTGRVILPGGLNLRPAWIRQSSAF